MKSIELIDNLTSIGNSLYLYQNYHEYMKQYENVQLIMIDLEKFKQINDSFGHNIGDLYLKVTAKLLTKSFPNSLVARIHGDEFIVLTYYNEKEIEQTFLTIEEEIQELVRKEIIPVLFRLNAGSSLFDANNIDSSKEKADLMMYIAKSNGSFYQAFSEYDWQLNEREKKVLIQFDNLLKEKEFLMKKGNYLQLIKSHKIYIKFILEIKMVLHF